MASSSQIVNVYQRVSFIHHIFPINHHSKTIYIYIIFPYIFPIKSHQPSRNEEGPVLVSARTSPSRTSIHDLGWDCGETWFSLFFAFHWQKQLKFEQENECEFTNTRGKRKHCDWNMIWPTNHWDLSSKNGEFYGILMISPVWSRTCSCNWIKNNVYPRLAWNICGVCHLC